MTEPSPTRWITYRGMTTAEAEAAYAADARLAAADGFQPTTTYWDTSQPQPTLVVQYDRTPAAPVTYSLQGTDDQAVLRRKGRAGRWVAALVGGVVVLGLIAVAASPAKPDPSTPRDGAPPTDGGAASPGVTPTLMPAATSQPTRTPLPTPLPPAPTMRPAPTPQPTPVGYLSKAMFGRDWPFTVKEGMVRCEPGNIVVFRAGGVDYAVNGMAMSWAERNGYADVDAIWRDDPKFKGLKISIGPIIDAGLELCG